MMSDEIGVGRFPAPDKWILQHLPEELHGMFGFRDEPTHDDGHSDEIQYVFTVELPGGGTMKKALLMHYVNGDDPTVAFIIDDTIELDGIPFTVKTWDFERVPARHGEPGRTHHLVGLAVADD